ncbi:MAG: hypothetical protein QF805_20390, partial [Pirellulaceae bacterium]|nr:hypothetical protein [Pirellulaceae bacterium]
MNRLLSSLLTLTLGCLVAGCEPTTTTPRRKTSQTQATGSGGDVNLETALNYLERMSEFSPQQASIQSAYYFNQWLKTRPEKSSWSPDLLVARLPRETRETKAMERLDEMQFRLEDIEYLEGVRWCARISNWAKQRVNKRLRAWVDQQGDQLTAEQKEQLLIAERMFDWTVRNIQLDEMPPPPKRNAVGPTSTESQGEQALSPPARAVIGPGYTLFPHEALLYGHGDAHQRGRLFIRLCQQQHIDAVMLAIDRGRGQTDQWIPAALIGGELYLFDPQLGLPIPTPTGGVATLSAARQDPAVLAQLSLEDLPYPVQSGDLKSVVVEIDANPQQLSRRMAELEPRLTAGHQMRIMVEPTALANRLRKLPGVSGVRIWSMAFDALAYRSAIDRIEVERPELIPKILQERALFYDLNPLVRGRRMHFDGAFNVTEPGKPTAKKLYMQIRVDKTSIEKLRTDESVQRRLSLVRDDQESDAQWSRRIYSTELMLRFGKQHASFWMGLIHFENGDFGDAADWFEKRTIDAHMDGMWTNGARYNLARTYEA